MYLFIISMIDVGPRLWYFWFLSFPSSRSQMRVEEREKESSGHMCVWMTSVACTIFRAISRRTYTNALLASFYFPRFILQWVYLTKPHHHTWTVSFHLRPEDLSLDRLHIQKAFLFAEAYSAVPAWTTRRAIWEDLRFTGWVPGILAGICYVLGRRWHEGAKGVR